jgi:TonB family protein
MNRIKITILLFLVISEGISQSTTYEYPGRLTPSIKKETLNFANSITDITPDLHRYIVLPYNDQTFLDQQVRLISGYIDFAQENYNKLMDFESIEITANSQGISRTFRSTGNILTVEQKNLLNNVDVGSQIYIILRFNFKNQQQSGQIINGYYAVTVVPETEAGYPGGFEKMSAYLNETIFSKISGKQDINKILQTVVKFTIDESGQISDAKISRSSADPRIDRIVLDAINNMPRWNPAKNTTGIKIKEEFTIPFAKGC